jgi:predicted nucleic acid-binding protein
VQPRGRPAATRAVHSFEEVFPPDELVLDTSFVFDALVSGEPRHEACREFLARIAEAGSVVYFNRLLEAELWELAYKAAIKERHRKGDWKKLRLDGRYRVPAKALQEEVESAWRDALKGLSWVEIEMREAAPWVPAVMADWGLSSFDAFHAATAVYADVEAIVTLDAHFGQVPPAYVDLYVPANRVAPCRQRRARSAASIRWPSEGAR